MYKFLGAVGLALMLSACGSTTEGTSQSAATNNVSQSQQVAGETAEQEMICRYEQRIGSNRKQRTCYTPEQLERQREDAERRLSGHDSRAISNDGM